FAGILPKQSKPQLANPDSGLGPKELRSNAGGAQAGSVAQAALLDQHDALHPAQRQVVGGAQTNDSATNHDDLHETDLRRRLCGSTGCGWMAGKTDSKQAGWAVIETRASWGEGKCTLHSDRDVVGRQGVRQLVQQRSPREPAVDILQEQVPNAMKEVSAV